jgi:hypothetical protein
MAPDTDALQLDTRFDLAQWKLSRTLPIRVIRVIGG